MLSEFATRVLAFKKPLCYEKHVEDAEEKPKIFISQKPGFQVRCPKPGFHLPKLVFEVAKSRFSGALGRPFTATRPLAAHGALMVGAGSRHPTLARVGKSESRVFAALG